MNITFQNIEPRKLSSIKTRTMRYRFGFNGKENDNEVKGTGNQLNYNSRIYDPRLGRWLSIDKLARTYPDFSPYNFALNTPIQAKDPDGNVVLFINGQHAGTGGKSAYWGGYDHKVMGIVGDHSARYIDGAIGGWWKSTVPSAVVGFNSGGFIGSYLALTSSSNVSLKTRVAAGEAQGLHDAADIIANLTEGESIKIVTHSMGTAFARGYVKGLQAYADSKNIKLNFQYELDINSFQGANLPASPLVKRTDNKTGGLDGGEDWKLFLTGKSVPTVSKLPSAGVNDTTSPSDLDKGHPVEGMSTWKIPFVGNPGTESQKPIEQGNNNQYAPK